MIVWCAGLDETANRLIQTCTPNGHLHRVTYTRRRIDIILLMMGTWLPETCTEQKHTWKKNCASSWLFTTTKSYDLNAHQTVIYTEWHIPDIVLIQLILLMMGTWLPETCREQKQTYMKKELCVKLVMYKDYTEMHGQRNIKIIRP
jgi:hypothetical protein